MERLNDIELHLGDCLEVMKGIPDGSVDAVICDLPYGATMCKWDNAIPFEPLWAEYHRVCKPNAAVLLFGQMPFTALLVMSNLKEFRYEWVYEKTCASGFLNAKKMPLKCHESVSVFYRSLPTYNPQYTSGPAYKKKREGDGNSKIYSHKRLFTVDNKGNYYPRDLLRVSNPSWGDDKGSHPTQKPVALLEYLVRTYTDEGETVLDNTMGSGSTMVACVNTKRKGIGIELLPEYYEIAVKRVRDAQAQPALF